MLLLTISEIRKCSSAGCLKCVQFYNNLLLVSTPLNPKLNNDRKIHGNSKFSGETTMFFLPFLPCFSLYDACSGLSSVVAACTG